MNRLNFQQMEFRHVKLNFQQKEMQQMQLLEPIQCDYIEERPQLAHFTAASQHLRPDHVAQNSFRLGVHKFPTCHPKPVHLKIPSPTLLYPGSAQKEMFQI